jgi:hypothetical protein
VIKTVVVPLLLGVLGILIAIYISAAAFGISALDTINPSQNNLPNTTTVTITNGTTITIPNQGNSTQNNNPGGSLAASPLQQLQK